MLNALATSTGSCDDDFTVDLALEAAMHTRTLCMAVAILLLAPVLAAQNAKQAPPTPAPVPPEITNAKKVFIANGGGVHLPNALDFTIIEGGPNRPYDQFFAAIKNWGRYDIVLSPSDADLVLKIGFTVSDSGVQHLASSHSPFANVTPVTGQLRLVVLDPTMRVTLWTISEYAQGAMLESNRDKNFNRAMNTVVGRLKALAAPPPAVTP